MSGMHYWGAQILAALQRIGGWLLRACICANLCGKPTWSWLCLTSAAHRWEAAQQR